VSTAILSLSSEEATLAQAGGKGANLAALVRAGFRVPAGFIVGTEAYRTFLAANQIQPKLLAQGIDADDPVALEAISAEIRGLFTLGSLPAELDTLIRAAYAELANHGAWPPVAVRSSATAEDLPGLSFAGQQDTYLNVVGPDALIDAIKRCWGSLWTARAMGYRARNHIAPDGVALAVVVQVMIDSEVSGVLFTANPLTGRRDEIVIDASFGLGEAIVSGQVEPDHYVVDQRNMRITARKLGAKALAIIPVSGGGTTQVARTGDQQALTDAQILELARVAKDVAAHFGSPQDIEWAWASGQLYLLQSRPITSLYPLPDLPYNPDDLRVYFSFNSVQGVPEPLTPAGRSLFPILGAGILHLLRSRLTPHEAIPAAGGRLFLDATIMARDRRLRRVALTIFANIDPGAQQALAGLIEEGRIATQDVLNPVGILRLLAHFAPVIVGGLRTWLNPQRGRERAISRAEHFVAQVRQQMAAARSLADRLSVIERCGVQAIRAMLLNSIGPALIPGLLSQAIVDRWLQAWAGVERGTVRRLLRGLPGNVTVEMDLHLWAAAQAISADATAKAALLSQPADALADAFQHGELPGSAQHALARFLDRYGMRAVGEIDIGKPRWREDPRSIIQTLTSYLRIEDPQLAPDRLFREAAAESEGLAVEYVAEARRRKGRLRAALLGSAIRRMRALSGLREMPKYMMVKMFDIFRTALTESGRALAEQGKLVQAEDIFFVPLDTLKTFSQGIPVDLKEVVARERADYERECARRQVPRLLLSTGEVFYEGIRRAGSEAHDSHSLVGDGVSPGVVEGRVHVVLDPRGVRLEPGEILVCPATDPGWTPLFLSAGGLVMELGGMVTHGSVVAREYGIPAVVGVHDATTRLATGQRVRVDGSQGG
jgi:pyruvate,water dikinase